MYGSKIKTTDREYYLLFFILFSFLFKSNRLTESNDLTNYLKNINDIKIFFTILLLSLTQLLPNDELLEFDSSLK